MDKVSEENKEKEVKLSLQEKLKQLSEKKKTYDPTKPTPLIMIGVPILAWSHRFAMSFMEFWTELMTYQHKGREFHVCYNFKFRRPVHLAEEELAQDAVNEGATHLLLMDDDIYDVKVEDLLKLLDADKDVIGGIMYTGGFPHAMCAFRRYDANVKVKEQPYLKGSNRLYEVPLDQRIGIQPIDLIPFGFTLIKTSVFNKLKKPWFNCDSKAPTDSWFADSVLEAGLSYYAHFGVWLNHNEVTKENHQLKMQLGMLEAQQKQTGRVVELSPATMVKHEAIMRFRMQQAEKLFAEKQTNKAKFFKIKEGASIATPSSDELKPTLEANIKANDSNELKKQKTELDEKLVAELVRETMEELQAEYDASGVKAPALIQSPDGKG